MNKKKTTVFLLVVLVLLIAGAAVLYNGLSAEVEAERFASESKQEPEAKAGENPESADASEEDKMEAPDFTVLDADGNEIKLSDLRGKPLVLNFWASWCPPCKGEMPEFDKVCKELGDDVTFMMVDMVDGSQETMKTGEKFIAESGYSFPVYYDVNQEAAYGYGVRSIPTTYFIDAEGYVVTGAQGQIDEELLRKGIDMIRGSAE